VKLGSFLVIRLHCYVFPFALVKQNFTDDALLLIIMNKESDENKLFMASKILDFIITI
jgi:hypothetical protein